MLEYWIKDSHVAVIFEGPNCRTDSVIVNKVRRDDGDAIDNVLAAIKSAGYDLQGDLDAALEQERLRGVKDAYMRNANGGTVH